MLNWEDREYVNPRKKIFKNIDTGEILNLELQDDPDNISKDSETPMTAHNLNLAQQELIADNGTEVSATEPTTKGKVWIQIGKNYFNLNGRGVTSNGITTTFKNNEAIINGTITSNWALLTTTIPMYIPAGTYMYSVVTELQRNFVLAVTYEDGTSGTIGLITSSAKNIRLQFSKKVVAVRINIDGCTAGDVFTNASVKFQLEQGSTATEYEPYIEKAIYVRNDNGVYEEVYRENKNIVLYNNETGSNENIALLKDVSEYDYVEIYYEVGISHYSVKVYEPNNKNVVLNAYEWANTGDRVHFRTKTINISGTNIKVEQHGLIELYNGQINFVSSDNSICITKVVGIKGGE